MKEKTMIEGTLDALLGVGRGITDYIGVTDGGGLCPIEGEDPQDHALRGYLLLLAYYRLLGSIRPTSAVAEALGVHRPRIHGYLTDERRDPRIAGAFRDAGILVCLCGWVRCPGCEAAGGAS